MAQLQKFRDHFILMAEAGSIAVNQADEDAAFKLFKAAELLDPKNVLPKVGRGYLSTSANWNSSRLQKLLKRFWLKILPTKWQKHSWA